MGCCAALGQSSRRPGVAVFTKKPQNHPLVWEKKLKVFDLLLLLTWAIGVFLVLYPFRALRTTTSEATSRENAPLRSALFAAIALVKIPRFKAGVALRLTAVILGLLPGGCARNQLVQLAGPQSRECEIDGCSAPAVGEVSYGLVRRAVCQQHLTFPPPTIRTGVRSEIARQASPPIYLLVLWVGFHFAPCLLVVRLLRRGFMATPREYTECVSDWWTTSTGLLVLAVIHRSFWALVAFRQAVMAAAL